jgi:hypothetical protein
MQQKRDGPRRALRSIFELAREACAREEAMKHKAGLMATCAVLAFAVCSTTSGKNLMARTRTESSMAIAQQQAHQPSQEFQGTIEKAQSRYVLEDKASGATYQLDNQDKAKQFVDKDVKVTGTLDPSTNTIEVSEIQEEK